jgi:hypothetical protein
MQDRGSAHSTPRWVKMAGIIVVALLLLFGSLHLIGGELLGHALGGHGNQAPPSSVTEHEPHQR